MTGEKDTRLTFDETEQQAKLITRLSLDIRHLTPIEPARLAAAMNRAFRDLVDDLELFYKDGSDVLHECGAVAFVVKSMDGEQTFLAGDEIELALDLRSTHMNGFGGMSAGSIGIVKRKDKTNDLYVVAFEGVDLWVDRAIMKKVTRKP